MAKSDKDIDVLIQEAMDGATQLTEALKSSEAKVDAVDEVTRNVSRFLGPAVEDALQALQRMTVTATELEETLGTRARLLAEAEAACAMGTHDGKALARIVRAYGHTGLHEVLEKRPKAVEGQVEQYSSEFTNLFGTLAKLQDDLVEHFHPTSEKCDELARAADGYAGTNLPNKTGALDEAAQRVVPTLASPHATLLEAATQAYRSAKDGSDALIAGVEAENQHVSARLRELFGAETGNVKHMLDQGRVMMEAVATLMKFMSDTYAATDEKMAAPLADTAKAVEGLAPILKSIEVVHRLGVA